MPAADAAQLAEISYDTAEEVVSGLRDRFSQAIIVAEIESLWSADPDPVKRARLCYVLGRVGGPEAQSFLNAVLAAPGISTLIRNEAVRAAQALVGYPNVRPP
jgi:hypothetical protein